MLAFDFFHDFCEANHIGWMQDETDAKKILTASALENCGRPRTMWMMTIQKDLKYNNLSGVPRRQSHRRGSCPVVTPYYSRLVDLLCFMYVYRYSCLLLSLHVCFVLFPLFDLSFVDFPSVLRYCWCLLTCKNRFPYNLYCVGGDVKHCTIQSNPITFPWMKQLSWLRIVHSGDWCLLLALCTPWCMPEMMMKWKLRIIGIAVKIATGPSLCH